MNCWETIFSMGKKDQTKCIGEVSMFMELGDMATWRIILRLVSDSKTLQGTVTDSWRIIPLSKWLGSPRFTSHGKAIWKGNNPILRGLTITMVINHLLTGMILQVGDRFQHFIFFSFLHHKTCISFSKLDC